MAYAAVTSLYHTIYYLLSSSRTSLPSSTKKILRLAGQGAKRLLLTLKRYDEIKNNSEGVMAVDARIRDEARKLEDAIESEASAQFVLQSQSDGRLSINLHHLRHDIHCFVETAKKMRAEYMEELYKPSPEEEAAAAVAVSSASDSGAIDCNMVGLSDLFLKIRDFIAGDLTLHFISCAITGMAGIGKTTLVKKLFHDSLVKEKFECRAFVRVGQKYQFEEILRDIIAQLNVDSDQMIMEEDENIDEYLKRSLRGRKFLIVLDDVWDVNFGIRFSGLLPGNCDGSFVLETSRIDKTMMDARYLTYYHYHVPFLNEEESWELLRRKGFGEGECPIPLIKAGKKIADNCEGLPLLIITVAELLFKAPKDPQYWNEVAEMQNSVFEDAMDQIYHLLLPSYHYLTQNSKACFLFMAVFHKN